MLDLLLVARNTTHSSVVAFQLTTKFLIRTKFDLLFLYRFAVATVGHSDK
jgi:hypothetical protein